MLRQALAMILASVALLAAPAARAEYPEKNIEFVIPFGTGGGFDRTVRMISPFLEKVLPKKVEVLPKNVPGAGGRKGLATVYRAKPDGHTIAIVNVPGAAIPGVMGENVEYDLAKFIWVARLASEEYMVAVAANSPIRAFEDLRRLGRPVKFTSTDFGSTAYAATAILGDAFKIPVQSLTGYKGTNDYIVAVIRGDGDATMAPVSTLRQFIASGDMRGLVTAEKTSSIKGVPTIAELGQPELTGLAVERFVLAPPGTPVAVTQILSDSLMKAANDPQLKELAEKSGEPLSFLPAAEAKASADRALALYLKYKSVIGKR